MFQVAPASRVGDPGSLDAVLSGLESDHAILTEGGDFTPDLIETWFDYERSSGLDPIRLCPHPSDDRQRAKAVPDGRAGDVTVYVLAGERAGRGVVPTVAILRVASRADGEHIGKVPM